MAEIEISSTRAASIEGSSRVESGRRQRLLNTITMWFLVLLLVLAPLPFASVRGAFSGLWAVYIGVLGVVYLAVLSILREPLRNSLTHLAVPSLLLGGTSLFLIVQLLPIGNFAIPLPDGSMLDHGQISIAPGSTILMICRQLSYALFAFLVLQVCANDNRRSVLLGATLVIIIGYGLYGMIALYSGDTVLGLPKRAYFGVVTGPMVNRNSFATFIAMGAVLALSMMGSRLVRQAERHRDDGRIADNFSTVMLLGIAYAFLVVVVISTQSRMGLVATIIGSAVVVLLILSAVRNLRINAYLVIGLLAVVAAVLTVFGSGVFERLGSVESQSEVRTDLYRQTWDLIMLRPWTGFGGGSYELAFPLVQHFPVSPDLVWERAHNSYLGLWAELGLVFGSLPILALAWLAWRLLRGILDKRGSWRAQTAAFAVIVVCAVHSLSDFSLEIPANTLLFVALVAAGAAATTGGKEQV